MGESAVAALLRGWSGADCGLGPSGTWPAVLRNALQMILPSPAPMIVLWGEQALMFYNDGYAAIAGARHPDILGKSAYEGWPEIADYNREVVTRVFAGETLSYRDLSFVLSRNGSPEEVCLSIDYSPLVDETGATVGVLAVLLETTESVRAEELLRQRERELAQVQKIGRVGGLEVDLRSGFRNRRSPEYLEIHGLPPDAAQETHEAWVARLHPEDRDWVERRFREAVAGDVTDYHAEYRIIRPSDGKVRWISAAAQIERDAQGRPQRLIGAHRDVTERRENEAEQRLLMQELAHRVKNTMAMIQAIASQTLRSADSLASANEAFTARLGALARAHDLLVAGQTADANIVDIVRSIIGIHGDASRFDLQGGDVVLGPKAALALTLILHELTTNAVRYGALSNATGRVGLSWRVDEIEGVRQFRLRWQESGGPPVTPPARSGFGSRLIERSFPGARHGTASAYLPGGLLFTLDAPFDTLAGGREDGASP